jgi:hypothetical protein
MLVELVSFRCVEASRNGAPIMELEEQNIYAKKRDESLIHRKVIRRSQDYQALAVGTIARDVLNSARDDETVLS